MSRDPERPHRRAAMACLVTGVYRLEKDRKHGIRKLFRSHADTAGTSIWWTHFRYELVQVLTDPPETRGSNAVFGAVFRSQLAGYCGNGEGAAPAPAMVIAFRGTMMRKADLKAELRMYVGRLESDPWLPVALKAVESAVEEVGWERVCVAGHSKGAALAALVGRAMADKGKLIEAHLFNPPHPTAEAASMAMAEMEMEMESESESEKLEQQEWRPRVYVNTQDPVSSAYIGFYEADNSMPARLREAVAAPPSIGKCIQRKLGIDPRPHRLFIPRAQLFIHKPQAALLKPHKLLQWCDLHLQDLRTVDARRSVCSSSRNDQQLVIV